jgi:hypothetical protein
MILIMHTPGQLGNKLFLFAHFLAFGMEHQHTIVNISFGPYEQYFPLTRQIHLCPFPAYRPVEAAGGTASDVEGESKQINSQAYLRRGLLRLAWTAYHASGRIGFLQLVRIVNDEHRTRYWDMSGNEFINLARSTRCLMTDGWLFRHRPGLQKHASAIRKFFVPIEPHRSEVASIVSHARATATLLVGVHIRRGDYRTFLGGSLFYEYEQYAEIMRRIESLYAASHRVSFLICSDEPVPTDPFRGLNINFSSGHLIEDLYALAKCDLLTGPWSTFSGWASFYGSVPWYRIENPKAEPSRESFRSLHEIWANE